MTFNINWDKKGVYIKFRGTVTAQDLIDANNYILSNAYFESISYQIFDFLNIDDFKVTSHDITLVAVMDKSQTESKEKMKIGILTSNDYVKAITSEYDQFMIGSEWETKIFETAEAAKDWINTK